MSHPFNSARPASRQLFVGRDPQRERLVEGLIAGRSYGVLGEQGVGTTSLLFAVTRELQERGRAVAYFDGRMRRYDNLGDVLETLLRALGKAQDTPPAILEQAAIAGRRGRLSEGLPGLLDDAFARTRQAEPPVLLLDHLHRVDDLHWLAELGSTLRPQVDDRRLAIVLAGNDSLAAELRNDASVLRHLITAKVRLGPLTRPEVEALVVAAGCPFEAGAIDHLHTLSGGHPFRIHAYAELALSREPSLSVQALDAVRSEAEQLFDESFGSPEEPTRERRRAGTSGLRDVFISYSSKDRPWVRDWLLPRLEARGLSTMIDQRDFVPGRSNVDEIVRAHNETRRTLFILTPNWTASDWTHFESLLADPGSQRIIPVLCQDCEIPMHLRHRVHADLRDESLEELDRLIHTIRRFE